jgi:pantothenate kinase type III
MMRSFSIALFVAAAMSLAVPRGMVAQEHPTSEHPMAEHPSASKAITMDQLAQAIQQTIEAKAKEQGGKFHVQDPVLHKTWALTLVRVHKDRLAELGPDTYFACTDFRATDGTMLDVDFYMKDENGKLTFSDTAIHKVNGKPRFTYKKVGKYWERVKV